VPSAATAALISLPVSAVVTGNCTVLDAAYCGSVGLNRLVVTNSHQVRRRKALPAHFLRRARDIDGNIFLQLIPRFNRAAERP
jgi:hypothetical protein